MHSFYLTQEENGNEWFSCCDLCNVAYVLCMEFCVVVSSKLLMSSVEKAGLSVACSFLSLSCDQYFIIDLSVFLFCLFVLLLCCILTELFEEVLSLEVCLSR